jgi:hypothetical protein
MTTDYRAMCAELVDELEHTEDWPTRDALLARARALLAQPVAEGPTDEEMDEFALFWWGSDADERTVTDVIECCSMAAFARAVLARYGRPTPQPVAVGERLPGPEDCDEKGRCWWHRYTPTKEWHLQRVYIGRYNYWLPANALPTPEAT